MPLVLQAIYDILHPYYIYFTHFLHAYLHPLTYQIQAHHTAITLTRQSPRLATTSSSLSTTFFSVTGRGRLASSSRHGRRGGTGR